MKKSNRKSVSKQKVICDDNEEQGGMINFYKLDSLKPFIVQHYNPNYSEEYPILHPYYMILCGSSGSGKTNTLANILIMGDQTFNKVVLFTQNKAEPIYEFFENIIPDKEFFEIHEGYESIESYNFDTMLCGQSLVIFDDMLVEKNQRIIEGLYTRARKLNNKMGCSVIYLAQTYYDIPMIIRKNSNYVILKKLNGTKDIGMVLSNYTTDGDTKALKKMYDYCVKSREDITNFLFIDQSAPEESRFRKNFTEILSIDDFK